MKNIISYQQLLNLALLRRCKNYAYIIRRYATCFTGHDHNDLSTANDIINSICNANTGHSVYSALLWGFNNFYGLNFNPKLLTKRSGDVSKFTTRLDLQQLKCINDKFNDWCSCQDLPPYAINYHWIRQCHYRCYHAYNILIHTGMRVGELAKINFQTQPVNRLVQSHLSDEPYYEIIINTEKTCKKREVYIPKLSFDFFKADHPLNYKSIQWSLHNFCNWAKFPFKLSPHTCRRTFATLMHEAGVDISTIAMVLGNTPQVVMNHYILSSARNFDACDMVYGSLAGVLVKANNLYLTTNWSVNPKK